MEKQRTKKEIFEEIYALCQKTSYGLVGNLYVLEEIKELSLEGFKMCSDE